MNNSELIWKLIELILKEKDETSNNNPDNTIED